MHPDRVELVIRHAPRVMLAGALLWGASRYFSIPGAVTGFMLVALGASGGTFTAWRREPGLWMLAGLYLLVWLPICIVLQLDFALHGLPAGQWDPWQLVDFAASLAVMSWQVGFLVTVFRVNRGVARPPPNDDAPV